MRIEAFGELALSMLANPVSPSRVSPPGESASRALRLCVLRSLYFRPGRHKRRNRCQMRD